MKVCYYFDHLKTHIIECGVDVHDINVKSNKETEIDTTVYIQEIKDNKVLMYEETEKVFTKPASETRDIIFDIIRSRYKEDNKWIFEIRNMANAGEAVIVGLISETALDNPIGVEYKHDAEHYSSELKANNLSLIKGTALSPIIKQTVISEKFDLIGYPKGFTSETSLHDNNLKIMNTKEFKQDFPVTIPSGVEFVISMNIAPKSFYKKYDGKPISVIEIENLGLFKLYDDRYVFEQSRGIETEFTTAMFNDNLTPKKLFDNGFLWTSELSLIGDGRGALDVRYNGKQITAGYNEEDTVSYIEMKNAVSLESELEDDDPHGWIESRLDNMKIHYRK